MIILLPCRWNRQSILKDRWEYLFFLTPLALNSHQRNLVSQTGLALHMKDLWLHPTAVSLTPVFPNSDSADLVGVRSHSAFCVSEESQFSTNWDLFTLPLAHTVSQQGFWGQQLLFEENKPSRPFWTCFKHDLVYFSVEQDYLE